MNFLNKNEQLKDVLKKTKDFDNIYTLNECYDILNATIDISSNKVDFDIP